MAGFYCFGIELEMVATPRDASEAARYMRDAGTDDLKYHLEYYDELPPKGWQGWFITSDSSNLKDEHDELWRPPIVPLETVSGILETVGEYGRTWQEQIEYFWMAQSAIFHIPESSTTCGTHVHITPGPAREWSLDQVKRIAIGIIRYKDQIQRLLPAHRRSTSSYDSNSTFSSVFEDGSAPGQRHANKYLRRNSDSTEDIREVFRRPSPARAFNLSRPARVAALAYEMNRMADMAAIVGVIQDDRRALWNFANLLQDKKTIEFRGGRGLRGPQRTKWCIAFVVGFVDFLMSMDADTHDEPADANVKWLYAGIRWRAHENRCRDLSLNHEMFNETIP
ncbi:hypothetical protein B0A48_06628 [Cryoendolithus antarcticus]|uniref:Amidoligase enzyme n=1 Tax=Cryoendolithus antarcticus TaxID=1507870 RepID=A0A1V8T8V1_9PEZI|nr:hypothetical protein B0A48_06628 [Cryoendolithus antarcticus]